MTIYFGLAFDEIPYPMPEQCTGGISYLGPQQLLLLLESHLGLSGHPPDNEYLRIEQYRQALSAHLRDESDAFFRASFEADQFATAANLLNRRDELLLAGWQLLPEDGQPERLRCLCDVESRFTGTDHTLAPGYADRFIMVLQHLPTRRQPIQYLWLNEPMHLLPTHWQKLVQCLQHLGVRVQALPHEPASENCDLADFQQIIQNPSAQKRVLRGDGSLLVIRGKRDLDLAAFVATLLRRNPNFRPLCLITDKNRSLDEPLVQEGLPALGIPSASLARPTLQVLKLAPAFLWQPLDPFKVMEFVSLAIKPLEDELANNIAMQIAQTPGINSDSWYAMLARYFEELDARAQRDASLKVEEVRQQYRFWFDRRRYDITKTVPKEDVIDIFDYLTHWARSKFEDTDNKHNALLVLHEQAKRISELLRALPETQLSHLELERIVRTIYESSPVLFHDTALGHLPHIYQPNGLLGPAEDLLWWNFTQAEATHFFSRWYQLERRYLENKGVRLATPATENEYLIWQRRQPVLHARQRLLLLIPAHTDGTEVHPHPLYGNLEAAFANLEDILYDIDTHQGRENLSRYFDLPQNQALEHRKLGRPRPFLYINSAFALQQREVESQSSLETLFYYPYQWVFRHKIRLTKSSILSIVKDNTLMGNLAHRFFEKLLQEDISNWNQQLVAQWIDEQARNLLAREGAVLLLYGREPERINFIKRLKYAAWSLVSAIQRNGWQVVETEKLLEGKFLDITVNGRADLVLERNGERVIIDLKWRGAKRREESIRNEEDLQLTLYSKLLPPEEQWAHTAYFIMENGKFIARNSQAFQEARAVAPDSDHAQVHERILARMQATYTWRMQQIQSGHIEIRCAQTQKELEEWYQSQDLFDILEMRSEDAPFDDYRTLINLIE